MTARVDGVPWAGRLVTTVTATSAEGASATESTTTWLIPWLGLLGIALLLALAGWYIHRRRTRIRRSLAKAESAPRIDVPALR
jgi:LPXTG-motif cell wall-anchored protein